MAREDGVLRTLLGSCIGLALYDRKRKVGGLAHVVLPQSRGETEKPGKFVDTAIPALIRDMKKLAGGAIEPTARIVGGANMFATEVVETIGKQNIEASARVLEAHRIPIVGHHCGGDKGRRMSLDTATGLIIIEIVGADPIELPDTSHPRRAPHGHARAHR
ncbi:MAG: chemotaxis protein CheD [Planctomycetota bacterium]